MRDDENQPDDEGARGYPALRWVLVLLLTAIIVTGGVAMLGRAVWKLRDMKGLFVVALGAVGGLWVSRIEEDPEGRVTAQQRVDRQVVVGVVAVVRG